MQTRTWLGLAAATLLIGGCSNGPTAEGDPTEDGFERVTTTLPIQDPCRFTPLAEVGTVFGGSPELSLGDGRCRIALGRGAEVALDIRPSGSVEELVGAEAVDEDLGDRVVWGATPTGGTLAVEVGDVLVYFEVVLPERPEDAEALARGWARSVVARIAEDPDGGVVDRPSPGDPCDLVPERVRRDVLGEDWSTVEGPDGAVCTLRSAEGDQLFVGPLVVPATAAQILSVSRSSGTGDAAVEWPRATVPVGDASVLLAEPGDGGEAELYVLDGVGLLRISTLADDPEDLLAEVAQALVGD